MFSGYAIGGMTSALLGAWLVKDMGWQIMFLIGITPPIPRPAIKRKIANSVGPLAKAPIKVNPLMQQWSLTAVEAGLLASAALFGMMFGAMIFGTL
jgi:MFS family permease